MKASLDKTCQITITNTGRKIFKKLPKKLREKIYIEAQILKTNPYAGESLQGRFTNLRSLHVSFEGVAYRIIYKIFPASLEIEIQLATSRENIYRKLEEMGL